MAPQAVTSKAYTMIERYSTAVTYHLLNFFIQPQTLSRLRQDYYDCMDYNVSSLERSPDDDSSAIFRQPANFQLIVSVHVGRNIAWSALTSRSHTMRTRAAAMYRSPEIQKSANACLTRVASIVDLASIHTIRYAWERLKLWLNLTLVVYNPNPIKNHDGAPRTVSLNMSRVLFAIPCSRLASQMNWVANNSDAESSDVIRWDHAVDQAVDQHEGYRAVRIAYTHGWAWCSVPIYSPL